MGKYDPLQKHLMGIASNVREIRMTFSQIENILGAKLPHSAHVHRAWWANETVGSHVEARSWMEAGWRVETVNFAAETVRFTRDPLTWRLSR